MKTSAKKTKGTKTKHADVDALFQGPLDQFIRGRDALAKTLRERGKAERAREIQSLRKPSLSAWTVNQLFFKGTAWSALEAAGRALKQSYGGTRKSRGGATVHKAQRDLNQALGTLDDEARRILKKAGLRAGASTLERIGLTLRALALRAPSDDVEPGHLTQDITPPGIEAFAAELGTVASKSQPVRPAAGKQATRARPAPRKRIDPLDKPRKQAERELTQRRRAVQTAERRVAAAQRTLDASQRALDAAARALEEAKHAEKAARAEAEKAAKAVEKLR